MCPVEVVNGRCTRDEDRSIREEKTPKAWEKHSVIVKAEKLQQEIVT